jgi:hypothetical protein
MFDDGHPHTLQTNTSLGNNMTEPVIKFSFILNPFGLNLKTAVCTLWASLPSTTGNDRCCEALYCRCCDAAHESLNSRPERVMPNKAARAPSEFAQQSMFYVILAKRSTARVNTVVHQNQSNRK